MPKFPLLLLALISSLFVPGDTGQLSGTVVETCHKKAQKHWQHRQCLWPKTRRAASRQPTLLHPRRSFSQTRQPSTCRTTLAPALNKSGGGEAGALRSPRGSGEPESPRDKPVGSFGRCV